MMYLYLAVQVFSILVIWSCMILVFFSKKSFSQNLLIMLLCCNLFNMIGGIFNICSATAEGTLVGLKIAYFGKIFAPLFILFFVMAYCRITIPHWLSAVLSILHTVILVAVWTCEHHTLYYKKMVFVNDGYWPHFTSGPGPLHHVFIVLMVLYSIAILALCIRRLCISGNSRERGRMICLILMPPFLLVAFVLYKLNVFGCYDCTNLAYVIDTVLLTIAVYRFGLADYVSLAKDEIIDELTDGIAILSHDGALIYYNRQMVNLLPDIESRGNADKLRAFMAQFEADDGMWIQDRHYICRRKENAPDDAQSVSICSFTDNTDNYLLTYVDGLTNVNNRRALRKDLEHFKPSEHSCPYLTILDIDDFKQINDTLGHQAGDRCLIKFSECLSAHFGKNAVYRFGGDEFVLLTDLAPDLLKDHLNALNTELSKPTDGTSFHVSGGYVPLREGGNIEDLMKQADDALYRVKKSEKGTFAPA